MAFGRTSPHLNVDTNPIVAKPVKDKTAPKAVAQIVAPALVSRPSSQTSYAFNHTSGMNLRTHDWSRQLGDVCFERREVFCHLPVGHDGPCEFDI